MGVLIVDYEPDSNGLLIQDSEMEELVKELRLRDSWEVRVSLMVATEAVRSHLHERSVNNNLLLVRRLARDKHGRRYKRLMKRVAKAMQKGPQDRVAALQTVERVMALAFGVSPDSAQAKQRYKTMLSEMTRAQREGVKNSA